MAKSCNSGLIYPLCTMPLSVKHLHSACSKYALVIEKSIYITQLLQSENFKPFKHRSHTTPRLTYKHINMSIECEHLVHLRKLVLSQKGYSSRFSWETIM